MFFPVRKKLKIGLGLVNAVNVSELKAVIAHEFGHFSQRSMKVGSYVYQVNRIIYDMLYNNKGYVSSLQGFARVSNIFALFAQLTIIIVQGIQWILIQMFSVVNKSHRSLSRQMEFHADHVAAAVSGSNNMISALRRIELADSCYQAAIDVCNSFWNENKVVANIYAGQSTVLQLNAPRWQIELQNGLPLMDQAPQHKTANRVNFKDQWASHPTLEDRVAQLEKLGLEAPVQSDAAWSLFVQVEELKKELTRKLYRNLPAGEQKSVADAASFEEVYSDQVKHYSLPKEYKGFYDDRQIEIMDIEEVLHTVPLDQPLEELLSGHNVGLYKNIQATAYDIEVLKAIESKQLDVKSFDFDGYKYKRQEAASIREQLEKELDDQKKRLTTLDQQITACFCLMAMNKSVEKGVALKEQYRTYFNHRREADAWLDSLQSTMNPLQPIYAGETLTFEVIEGLINTLTHQNEPVVKTGLKNWLAKGAFDKNALLKQKVENFIGSTYTYFENKKFLEEQLKDLNQVVQEGWTAVQEFLFEEFKAILEGQRSLLKEDTSSMNVLVS
jgi:Zn-dependent protease with chaperone function